MSSVPNLVDMAGFERSVLGVFEGDVYDADYSMIFAKAAAMPSTGRKLENSFHFAR